MKTILFYICLSFCCFGQKIIYSEDFDHMPFGSISDKNWITKNIEGKNIWRISSHKNSSSRLYVKISGYKGGNIEKDWLILVQDLSDCYQASFEFESAIGYYKHNGLTIWTSDSEDFSTAFKIDSIRIANSNDLDKFSFSPFISSGKIDISSYCGGSFYLGFRYLGNNTTESTVFEIDNIKIWTNE